MLVNELWTALEQYDNAVLKEIIVSLYKMIPSYCSVGIQKHRLVTGNALVQR